MKKFSLVLIFIASLPLALSAQNGKYEAVPFSRLERNPASLGMGTAGFADLETVSWASFRNAALVSLSDKKLDVAAAWTGWAPSFPDGLSHHINAGLSLKLGAFGITAGASYMPGKPYDVVYESGISGGKFTPTDLQANIGASYAFLDFLSVGLNARFLSQSLAPERTYSTFAGDLSLAYHQGGLTASAGISNVGLPLTSNDGTQYPIPTSATLGASYLFSFAQNHAVKAALDFDYFFAGHLTFAAGVQYTAFDMFSVRAGYHFGTEGAVLPSFLCLGAGVKVFGIRLDVSYITANSLLGNTLTAGLAYSF